MLQIIIIYVDNKKDSRLTGIVLQGNSEAETASIFLKAKEEHEIETSPPRFIAYLVDDKDGISNAIMLNADGFTKLTGKPILTDEQYIAFDEKFYRKSDKGDSKND